MIIKINKNNLYKNKNKKYFGFFRNYYDLRVFWVFLNFIVCLKNCVILLIVKIWLIGDLWKD